MGNQPDLKSRVFALIAQLLEQAPESIHQDTPLIGSGVDSMKLIELCIQLEDFAAELNFEFDWTSSSAMSTVRSMFRTAGTLADEFIAQQNCCQEGS